MFKRMWKKMIVGDKMMVILVVLYSILFAVNSAQTLIAEHKKETRACEEYNQNKVDYTEIMRNQINQLQFTLEAE